MTNYSDALKSNEVKLRVIDLDKQGFSSYYISNEIGSSPRAVQYFLAKQTHKDWWDNIQSASPLEWMDNNSMLDLALKLKEATKLGGSVEIPKNIETSEQFIDWVRKDDKPNIRGKDEGKDNSRILLISDMHIPYHHPDTLAFLEHLKVKYNPTRIICLGDELDKHALSFHDSDPDLPSAGDELNAALPVIKELKKLFPVMDILESNHGSLVYRKAKHHGIPRQYLKSYNDVLGVDDNWKWWFDMTIELPNGSKCYLHHGKSSDVMVLSQQMGMCAVQGHYHERAYIGYWANPNGLYWGLQAGCLIDDNTFAFNYNNCNIKRPIISTALIVDSMPVLEPMVLDENGRWGGCA